MKIINNKFLKLIFLPAVLSSLLISCSTDLITNDLPLQAIDQELVEIQGQGRSINPDKPVIQHIILQGVVTNVLPDDRKGASHQHFMVKVTSPEFFGELIKVAHALDYAPYVPVKPGSRIEMKGDFIINAIPKVMHWTHRSYNDSPHPNGYIRLNEEIYN